MASTAKAELPDIMGTCPVCKRSWVSPAGVSMATVTAEDHGAYIDGLYGKIQKLVATAVTCPFCKTEWSAE
jgi:predicted Zn-ribbon and HTH transcriptional regulator